MNGPSATGKSADNREIVMNRLMTGLIMGPALLLGAASLEPAQAFESGQGASQIHSATNSNGRAALSHARGSKFGIGPRKRKAMVGLLLPAVQQVREAPRRPSPPPRDTSKDDCMSCD